MPGSSNNSSFIPKRGSTKRTRKVRNVNIYIISIAGYTLLFASLAAAIGVYFYSGHIEEQRNNEITTMNAAVSNFKEADMQRVQEFDIRLRQANHRLSYSASVVNILEVIEDNMVDTVRLQSISLRRDFDDDYEIEVVADTDTFDSSIFQRDTIKGSESVQAIEVEKIDLRQVLTEDGQSAGQSLSLAALISVPVSAVPYTAAVSSTPVPDVVPDFETVEPEVVAEEEDESEEVNQDSL